MADADLPPVRRWLALGAVVFAGIALGAALGSGAASVRVGALPAASAPVLVAALLGLVAGALALRSQLVLRLLPTLALYATAGLMLARLGPGFGVAFAAGPTAFWASRLGGGSKGILALLAGFLLGLLGSAPALLHVQGRWSMPLVAIVMGIAFIGALLALIDPGDERPVRARFDLRTALALGGLVVSGLAVSLVVSQFGMYVIAPREYGGLGNATRNVLGIAAVCGGIVGANIGLALPSAPLRILVGLGLVAVGFFLASGAGAVGLGLLALIGTAGVLMLVPPCLRRAGRIHEGVGPATVLLATLLGIPVAVEVVRAFSRSLPAPVATAGGEVAARISWPPILLFYGLLALVVLLAHLAHVYEFGLAALDPDDDRDPLPILRKGLPRRAGKS